MNRRLPIAKVLISLLLVLGIGAGIYAALNLRDTRPSVPLIATQVITPSSVSIPTIVYTPSPVNPTDIPIPTFPPLLSDVEFPTLAIDYPANWPNEIRYPPQFVLVETSSGNLPSGNSTGWAAKLRYQGNSKTAADAFSSFFTSNGWKNINLQEADSGGYLILAERGNKKQSVNVIISPDNKVSNSTKILATVIYR